MDHTKQEQKQSYYSQRRNHAVSTGRWGFSWRQGGHDHCHGDRKHSDASKHDITEYICCSWPAAVYITRGSWGFLEFSFRAKSGTTLKRGKRGFHNEVYCLKIQLQQSTFTIAVHSCRNAGVYTLYMLFGDRWEVDDWMWRADVPAIKPLKTG